MVKLHPIKKKKSGKEKSNHLSQFLFYSIENNKTRSRARFYGQPV
jgi:hypothetical protein